MNCQLPTFPEFTSRLHTSEPLTLPGLKIASQERRVTVRLPHLTLSWQRPVAVLVYQHRRTDRVPIHDATRLIQCALLGFALLAVGAISLAHGKERR